MDGFSTPIKHELFGHLSFSLAAYDQSWEYCWTKSPSTTCFASYLALHALEHVIPIDELALISPIMSFIDMSTYVAFIFLTKTLAIQVDLTLLSLNTLPQVCLGCKVLSLYVSV